MEVSTLGSSDQNNLRASAIAPAVLSQIGYEVNVESNDVLVELSGIEPLTSSLRIQGTTSDGEMPDDTE